MDDSHFPPAPDDTFSIAVIPDTQQYTGRGTRAEPDSRAPVANETFAAYIDWTVANLESQRIAFVSHVGDLVDVNRREEWAVARSIMDRLHGRVPYGISVGNKDMTAAGDSSLFQEHFPASRFREFDWYGGCYEGDAHSPGHSSNNANSYQLFSAAGLNFVIVHLECNAPDSVLAWADETLIAHAQRRAIVTAHMYLGPRTEPKSKDDHFRLPKGRMTWKKCHGSRGNTPQQMWDKCFRKHANLFMICCGDQSRSQAYQQTSRGDAGNEVHELLSDYGDAGMRVLRFVPSKNRIEVRTWNPLTNAFCKKTQLVPDHAQHRFDLDYEMVVT